MLPFKEDVLEKDILAPGDFFITSLLQFQPGSEELMLGSGASCKRKLQRTVCDDGRACRAFFRRNARFL